MRGTNTRGMLLSRLKRCGSRTWEGDEHGDEDGADWVGDHPAEHLHEDGRHDDAHAAQGVRQDVQEHALHTTHRLQGGILGCESVCWEDKYCHSSPLE